MTFWPIRGRAAMAVAAAAIMVTIEPFAVGCAPSTPAKSTVRPKTIAPARHAALPTRSVDCLTARCVALTFDDGPSRYTASLLGVLEQKHVVATFFAIGPHAVHYRQDVLRAYRDGDAIGDHTAHHLDLIKLASSQVSFEINTAAQQIAAITGHWPTLFRPPFGAQNAKVQAVARRAGLSVVEWNVDPKDWKYHSPPLIESRVLDHVRPGGIVDMHDLYATTLLAVPHIVDALKARGYTLVTVEQLFAKTGGTKPGKLYSHGP